MIRFRTTDHSGTKAGGDCQFSRFAGRVGTPCRPRRSRGDRPTGFGNCRYGYAYDSIGNRLTATDGNETRSYTSNELNQYTSIASAPRIGDRCLTPVANPVEPVYDADGILIADGRFEYTYDDENRLVSAYPITPAANDLAVENFYDHLHRRIQKTVYRHVDNDWTLNATHTFVWDGMNIVLERIAFANGTTRTCEYYWGPDRSGTEQGAGGVEGLLAVSIDGTFYFPLYGDNANIVGYISENGMLAAQYVYDPYGNMTETYGPSPDLFAFGFSTKYHDREINLIAYQRRFYVPEQGRWLNRDPIDETGGCNLYATVDNSPSYFVDWLGLSFGVIGPNSGFVLDTYDGASALSQSSLWMAVYGNGAFDVRRTLKYKTCSCSASKIGSSGMSVGRLVPPEFVCRLLLLSAGLRNFDRRTEQHDEADHGDDVTDPVPTAAGAHGNPPTATSCVHPARLRLGSRTMQVFFL